jgi:hypothetical protein
MAAALENACRILNLNDSDDPLVEAVAKKVISLASQRITDPDEITRQVIAERERPLGLPYKQLSANCYMA